MKIKKRLLLDAGNSRLKWAVVQGEIWLEQGEADYTNLSNLECVLDQLNACHIASVVREEYESQITSTLAAHGITPAWLTSNLSFGGVKNTYEQPEQLGVDRWMSLIATRARSRRPCLVVSAGTALTIDALSADGVFLGGVIVPGARLMRQVLKQGTARIDDVAGMCVTFPRCTADGVESGIVAALCGAIVQQHAALEKQAGEVPHCILTGGGAAMIAPHLPFEVEFVPTLVLEGIDLMTRESVAG